MLKLKDITKSYISGESSVLALKGINISFRKSEFVSILGQSGGGKSTLLNIIGGLDHYTDGDLIINGRSTKDFNDRDWDSYRNHSVGFVFQSYNLIPHQTVLSNVELSLTLQGIKKQERQSKALEALKSVGLEEQIHKKPTQLSGGQMQRVAIARALVNNPDILLADEPTGALDSETSVQVMDILKKVAKERLVIMVTHNRELAEKYSTRIISLRDGKIINDTNPFDGKEILEGKSKYKKLSMGYKSAFLLSLDNLLTKKGRTFLIAFAGSIGIIGIALILALSTGVNNYIKDIQEETMTSYPIVLNKESIDISAFTNPGSENKNNASDGAYSNNIILEKKTELSSSLAKNNLSAFKEYIESDGSKINDYLGKNGINYTYDTNYNIFAYDKNNEIINVDGSTLEEQHLESDSLSSEESKIMNLINSQMSAASDKNPFSEILKGNGDKNISDSVYNSYELMYGTWPEKYDQVVIVLNSNNEIQSTVLYQLGFLPADEYRDIMKKSKEGEDVNLKTEKIDYANMCSQKFYIVPACNYFIKNSNGTFTFTGTDNQNIDKLIKGGIELKISGVVRAKDNDNSLISGNVGYTHDLTKYIIDYTNNSPVVKEQKSNPDINVLTGIRFDKSNNMFTYDENLKNFGVVDENSPSSISIYVDSFEDKSGVNHLIAEYNDSTDEDKKIVYTDYVALLMSSVTRIINTITVVLVAFVSVSLVVSSIMIGIITYISVLERKKEIGILRAVGASKNDVSRVFVAETFIVGLFAGLIGVIITYFLRIPINALIYSLVGIDNVNVTLPILSAFILVCISVALTLISGLIPARIASKKDPAQALKSE